MRRAVIALLGVAVLLLAGCTGGPGPGTGVDTTAPDRSGTTPGPDTGGASHPAYDAMAVDTAPYGGPVFAGGIAVPDSGDYVTRRYVGVVASEADAAAFNHSRLDAQASAFVRNTSFADSYLVVVQSYPESSHPDYRVESVTRRGDTLDLSINDSSRGATADITVETVLVRVQGAPPAAVTVTTEEGDTWTSDQGVVTVTPPPTTEPPADQLPYTSSDPAENVDDPRDIVVENRGRETNGYRVEVEYLEVPECREATPPCGIPTREVGVLARQGKLRPNTSTRFADVAGRIGQYTITVKAEVPAADGSRRTVTADAHWLVNESAPDAEIVITDEDVRFVQPAPSDAGGSTTTTTRGSTETATPRTTTPS